MWLILSSSVQAADDKSAAQAPLTEIPLPEQPPIADDLQWTIIANAQGDGLLATSVDDYDRLIFRRARVSAVVDWKFDWRLRASGDFGKFHGLRDLSIEYRRWPVYLAAGRLIEPFGLLQGGSSAGAFMERPQPMLLSPGYGEGISANYGAPSWGATIGAFRSTQNDVDLGRRKENAETTRLTWAPLLEGDQVIHLGVAASRRDSGAGLQRFDTIPESALVQDFDTRSGIDQVATNSQAMYWLYGGEFAWKATSLLLQSEYVRLSYDHDNTLGPGGVLVSFSPAPSDGYYFEASWVLTGEQRDYSVRHGMFGNVFPESGRYGAVELAARYSHTNLRTDLPYHGPFGDRSSVASLGVNWYPDDSIKVMLEGAQLQRLSETSGVSLEQHRWFVQARLQWYFRWP